MAELIIVAICLLLNAVFSSIEMAFITVGKPELRQRVKRGDTKARRLLSLRENPERALSVIQVGITLVGAVSAAVGGAGAEENLAPLLEKGFGLSEDLAEGLAIGAIVVPLTYMSVVVGELVPKTIALRYPTQVLNFGAAFLHIGNRALGPIVTLLEVSTRWLVRRILPSSSSSAAEAPPSELDLQGLSTHQRQYILNLANIEMKKVRDALLPWAQVERIDQTSSFEDVLSKVIQSGHTRLPVTAGERLFGVLHSKEFLAFAAAGSRDWQTIVRPAVEVRPQDELLNVLRRLQDQKRHMAIVVDESRQLLGLITLEDIIEEVIGDVFDEDDDGLIRKILSGRRSAKARAT
ncbi:MAG: HlyC/CorC family transporter [Bdellovibrionaceae bacterium]|nr:HlyC/CorC family transporter [Pseudobdellovibrionaceae bacterium]